jgi:hypothetical protein
MARKCLGKDEGGGIAIPANNGKSKGKPRVIPSIF